MIEEQEDQKGKLVTLYLLGFAPILAWPICILASMMSSSDRHASEGYLFFILGVSILYPLAPIVCFAISMIGAHRGHQRIAYAAAWAPLIFYVFALVLSCGIYYLT